MSRSQVRSDLGRSPFHLGWAAGGLVFLLLTWVVVWSWVPVDDAFVTMRYADNLAAGEGAVFNSGERVEGYSSALWLAVLAGARLAGLSLPVASKALGVALGLAVLLVLARAAVPRSERLWATLLLATCLPWIYHSANGLETSLATFWVVTLVILPPADRVERGLHYVAAAGLTLTRPEGVVLVLIWVMASWLARRGDRFLQRHLLVVATVAVTTTGLQFALRWLYYQELLPNAARAKLLPLGFALPRGLSDLGDYLFRIHGSPLLFLLASSAIVGALIAQRRALARGHGATNPELRLAEANAARLLALALFVIGAGFVLARSGGDSFPLWRFHVPLTPVLVLLAAHAIVRLAAIAGRARAPLRPIVHGVIAVAIAVPSSIGAREDIDSIRREGEWKNHWARIGRSLAGVVPEETSMALTPVGALPYYSGLRIVDMLGLTNPAIARAPADLSYSYPGHQRHDGTAVLDREPDLIMLANGPLARSLREPFPWHALRAYEQDVVLDPRFRANYRRIGVPLGPGRQVQLFAHREFLRRRALSPSDGS